MNENELLEADPLGLNIDLSTVDTSRPVLKDGTYLFTVKELGRVEKKDDPSKHNLMATLSLAQKAEALKPDENGNTVTIAEGYQLRKYMPLQQSDKENAPDFRRDLVLFMCAVFKIDPKDKAAIPKTSPPLSDYIGRELLVTVKAVKDDNDQWQNEIKGIKKAD